MAEAIIKLRMKSRWVKREADGQKCDACGDACYLFPVNMMQVMIMPGKSIVDIGVVCASCFDIVEMDG